MRVLVWVVTAQLVLLVPSAAIVQYNPPAYMGGDGWFGFH